MAESMIDEFLVTFTWYSSDPILADYINYDFLLILGGDYPIWKYNKKIVAEVSSQFKNAYLYYQILILPMNVIFNYECSNAVQ